MPVIPNSSIKTSRLGFGTSGIMGSALTDRGRMRLLNFVLDWGVTHFDTAPLYGMGQAESLLGKFTKDRRSEVTIATKYGLNPLYVPKYYRWAVPVVRQLSRRSSLIKRLIKSRLQEKNRVKAHSKVTLDSSTQEGQTKDLHYDVSELQSSLESSLKNLQTDYIDIYLLHECKLENLSDEAIKCLNVMVDSGKVLACGLATSKVEAEKIFNAYPELKAVVQVSNSIIDRDLDCVDHANNLLTITHGCFSVVGPMLHDYLKDNDQTVRRWSDELDFDLRGESAVGSLLLADALNDNKNGIVLFSSANTEHITANVQLARDSRFSQQQLTKLKTLIQQELKTK